MKVFKKYFEITESYIYNGFHPLLELLWSFSVLFGLIRFIEGLVTEKQQVLAFGLAFLIGGLALCLVMKGVFFLISRYKKGV